MIRKLFFATAAIASTLISSLAMAEVSFEERDEVEVLNGTPMERNVEVKTAGNVVLEFKAWYRAEKPAGFYSTLDVRWNGERLTEVLDRPETIFVEGLEREFRIRGEQGWLTAILPEPGAIEAPSPYYIPKETVDLVTYRFKLPVTQAGIYPLQILNALRDPEEKYFNVLMISDLRVYSSEE